MSSRSLSLLAAAAVGVAALPAVAQAKPKGPGHPGKGHGVSERFERSDRTGAFSEDAFLPALEESAPETSEPVADELRADRPAKHGRGRGRGRGRSKGRMTVFKGSVVSTDTAAATVVVRVRKRNRWARVFRGEEVTFSLETARVQVADVDGDGQASAGDITAGDRVVVKARVARGATDDGSPIAALRLIDLSAPELDEEEELEVADEAELEEEELVVEEDELEEDVV